MKGYHWKYIIVVGTLLLLFFAIPGPVKVWAGNLQSNWNYLWIIPGLIFGQLLRYVPPKGPGVKNRLGK